jgi:hypothetical protein
MYSCKCRNFRSGYPEEESMSPEPEGFCILFCPVVEELLRMGTEFLEVRAQSSNLIHL